MYDPRECTGAMGLTEQRSSRHAPHILQALDAQPCQECGRPVGLSARGLTVCAACALTIPVQSGAQVPIEVIQ